AIDSFQYPFCNFHLLSLLLLQSLFLFVLNLNVNSSLMCLLLQ
ncbi:hypothetical protein LINPERPRIM_LOCUS36873, partial [Linum perenne]